MPGASRLAKTNFSETKRKDLRLHKRNRGRERAAGILPSRGRNTSTSRRVSSACRRFPSVTRRNPSTSRKNTSPSRRFSSAFRRVCHHDAPVFLRLPEVCQRDAPESFHVTEEYLHQPPVFLRLPEGLPAR